MLHSTSDVLDMLEDVRMLMKHSLRLIICVVWMEFICSFSLGKLCSFMNEPKLIHGKEKEAPASFSRMLSDISSSFYSKQSKSFEGNEQSS